MGEVTHVVESIKRHLVRLLNAHPGNSASVPDLGLLDFNDATLGTLDLSIQIRGAIRQCIEKFEPRVKRVDVVALPPGPDPLQLKFQVTVYLQVAGSDDRTTIDLVLDDKGYYRVVWAWLLWPVGAGGGGDNFLLGKNNSLCSDIFFPARKLSPTPSGKPGCMRSGNFDGRYESQTGRSKGAVTRCSKQ